ncbi:PadR family transcriptional regulator [Candidatus Leptofilum sp.]|uniref:PadR family transcriptional regulator n=1 Tax=Candidatus Leptofilum sp. TaxID=3241576 RepID=UPI003B5C7F10
MPNLDELLAKWEEGYKKGLLSFWILLLLNQEEMYAYEMTAVIADMSQQTVSVDEKSIYRALKRFEDNQLIQSDVRKSDKGPPRRYFRLTENGRLLLAKFCERNILIFQEPRVAAAILKAIAADE